MPGRSSLIDHPAREVVDGALLAGLTPNAVFEKYGEAFGLARATIYRYANGKHSPLSRQWLDGSTTVQEAARDLGRVRADLLRLFADATARGADASAARLAREIATVTSTLKSRFDVDADDDQPNPSDLLEQWVDTLGLYLWRNPQHIPAVRDLAAERGHQYFADDLDALAERRKKENPQ